MKTHSKQKVRKSLRNYSREAVTPPWLMQLVKDFNTGKLREKETFHFERPYRTSDLLSFFKSGGDIAHLSDALKKVPDLLAHPVVWGFIQYMRVAPRRSINPYAAYAEVAQDYLCRLIGSWVEGMLPGWTLKPPSKKRGRKVSWLEEEFRRGVVQDYEDLLAMFKSEQVKRLPDENDSKYSERLERILERVYSKWQPPRSPTSKQSKAGQSQRVTRSSSRTIPFFHKPLLRETVQQWVEDEKKNGKIGIELFSDYLAQCLLSHQYGLTPNQVHWMIQQYRESANQP